MLLMIDNYDSFTYNLVQYFRELSVEVRVIKNDDIPADDAQFDKKDCDYLVISPGPCTPDDAGISLAAITLNAGQVPILGVCLGHQSIAQVYGAKVVKASALMHGKVSSIFHEGKGIFQGLPSPFVATRYHSLVVDKDTVPDEIEITAWTQTDDGEMDEIMGLKHRELAVEGVQFHPESILSEHGHQLLDNFLNRYRSDSAVIKPAISHHKATTKR